MHVAGLGARRPIAGVSLRRRAKGKRMCMHLAECNSFVLVFRRRGTHASHPIPYQSRLMIDIRERRIIYLSAETCGVVWSQRCGGYVGTTITSCSPDLDRVRDSETPTLWLWARTQTILRLRCPLRSPPPRWLTFCIYIPAQLRSCFVCIHILDRPNTRSASSLKDVKSAPVLPSKC